jgi:hypothetical protein
VKGEGFRWSSSFGERGTPGDVLRFRDQLHRRNGQRGHVQRLADVAGRIRPACVFVQEHSAPGEIQERHAAQDGQRAPQTPLPEN